MKKLIRGILMAMVILGFSSCRSDYDPLADGNYRLHREKSKPIMKTVSLNFGGDFITESEEPLLRAEGSHSYKAINVYSKEDNDESDYKIYARGLFVDQDNISINLLTGYKYRFEATVLNDDRDKVALYNGKYSDPFQYRQTGTSSMDDVDTGKINDFVYSQSEIDAGRNTTYFWQLNAGKTHVDMGTDHVNAAGQPIPAFMTYPRVKRFYGTLEDFEIIENNPDVEIPMAYKCFGLQIILEQLSYGTITVEGVSNNGWQTCPLFPKDLVFEAVAEGEEPVSFDGIFSMDSMDATSANITLQFIWDRGEGLESKTFIRTIEVHPKMNRILKLNVTGEAHDSKSGNIILNLDDETMGAESQEINYNS